MVGAQVGCGADGAALWCAWLVSPLMMDQLPAPSVLVQLTILVVAPLVIDLSSLLGCNF